MVCPHACDLLRIAYSCFPSNIFCQHSKKQERRSNHISSNHAGHRQRTHSHQEGEGDEGVGSGHVPHRHFLYAQMHASGEITHWFADSYIAIYTALQQLGYHPYHMAEAMKDPKRQLPLWEDALNAKYRGIGKRFGRTELDKILSNFDVGLYPSYPSVSLM